MFQQKMPIDEQGAEEYQRFPKTYSMPPFVYLISCSQPFYNSILPGAICPARLT